MKKEVPEMDKKLVQLLENSSLQPPGYNWEKIATALDKIEAEKYKTRYTLLRKTLTCLLLTGICLLLSDVLQDAFKKPHATNHLIAKVRVTEKRKAVSNRNTANGGNTSTVAIKQSWPLNPKSKTCKSADSAGTTPDDTGVYTPLAKAATALPIAPVFTSDYMAAPLVVQPRESTDQNDTIVSKVAQLPAFTPVQTSIKSLRAFYLAPYFSFDHITGRFHEQYEFEDQPATSDAKKEKPDMSYTFGLLAKYRVSNTIAVQAGLLFSNAFTGISATTIRALEETTGIYKFKLATTYGVAEIKNTGGALPQSGDSLQVNNGMLRLKTIAAPLLVQYNFKKGRVSLSPVAGIAISHIASNRVEVEYTTVRHTEKETIQSIAGLRHTYLSFIGGVEGSYKISKGISVAVNPVVRYAITPVNKGTPVKTYPVIIAAGAAVCIRL